MRRQALLMLICAFLMQGCADKTRTGATGAAQPGQKIRTGSVARRAEVLFLGNVSKHHDSGRYAPWLAITLFKSGVNLTYTTSTADLNTDNLKNYDGLIIYANHDTLSAEQENALKAFVEGGKGLIPLHSASGCFKNSEWYVKAIGGQFKSHGTGVFTGKIVKPGHPVMEGLSEFSTWDETYVHQNINPDMTVLMERVEGTTREPYTWVRNQGKGRVFYTAYGHNDSTWKSLGFQNLVRNGVLWALGDEVKQQIAALDIPDINIYPDTLSDYSARHLVTKIQEGQTPSQSQKLMQVPPGFEVQLFAAEPDITNPIAMAWDERGRLWIVESVDYPNTFLETDGAANDRIKICEDTNGDGKADKFTVFADSLNIPTSMVFVNGGIVVSQAPDFLFMKDTNGDDKADVRQAIITGWSKNDTHAGPSNLQYGFDNRIWGVNGYAGFDGEVGGKSMRFGQGVYRFTPDGKDLEYLAPTSNNTWGLGFSEDNNVFISTANNTHSAYYSMPARYMQRSLPGADVQAVQKIDGHYEAHTMTPNLRQVDVVGGFTSAAGHHLYTARSFPKEYWNRVAFVTEPTVRVVHKAIVEPDGAGFKEADGWNFLASSDEWVGPVQAEVGPDGALWVADWYNFIIQHNTFVPAQAPTEVILPIKYEDQKGGQGNALISPLRDLDRGRIYRVVYKDSKAYRPVKLDKDDTQSLLAALANDNMFWRITAQRLLVETKGQESIPGLIQLVEDQKVDEIGLNSPAVHALWTLHGIGALSGSNTNAMNAATKALSHPAAGVRKAAAEVLPKTTQTLQQIQKSGLLNDKNLNTRMAAFLVLAAMPPSAEAGKLIYQASLNAENGKDKWLSKALYAAAITHREGFLLAGPKYYSTTGSDSSLNRRILDAVSREIYVLERRSTMQIPPDVSAKEIVIKASLKKPDDRALEGVVVAHGNKQNGYGLYVEGGKLILAVNQNGKTYKAASAKPLPDEFDVMATISRGGAMIIEVNDAVVARAKAPALFKTGLTSGIRIGGDFDEKNKIAAYEGDFRLRGGMENASLELKEPGSAAAIAAKKPSAKTESSVSKSASAAKATRITINVVKDIMQFDKKTITVKAGQKVIIELVNPDGMQHNMLIIKPGTLQKVGNAADELARDPKGAEKNYVPKLPEVLYSTKLLNTGERASIEFTVPATPGDYPYVCTFPGHWRGMNGIMKVVK